MFGMAALPATSVGLGSFHVPKEPVIGSPAPRQSHSTWTQRGGSALLATAAVVRPHRRRVTRNMTKERMPEPVPTQAPVKADDQLAEASLKTAMAGVSKKLGVLERARGVCQSEKIEIPGVVVVGEQSSGKSSLLENISGIQFPRAENTCTRMPCVLQLLADASVEKPYAEVSMDPDFSEVKRCSLSEVEGEIKRVTEERTKGKDFITDKALHIRVVRSNGPQLCVIDLPGVTHNADRMKDIHQVTADLAEEYMKRPQMVILCVVPAMSDFSNAEVLKLAKKHDPDGLRTLGVVTKCDDAANAESSDIVEKVLMSRDGDVKLKLGFHCVVNRSQKDIDEGLKHEDLWAKERSIFMENDRMKKIPEQKWGIERLMQKIAKIQEAQVDAHLPEFKKKLQEKIDELEDELDKYPANPETDEERLNNILREVRKDLEARVKGESSDKSMTIAPDVASMILEFKASLLKDNPKWLEKRQIDEVCDRQDRTKGYTVDSVTGPRPHIFISLIKKTFIEDGLLKTRVRELIDKIGNYLSDVTQHVIEHHAKIYEALSARLSHIARDEIEQLKNHARYDCGRLVLAQQVTSTTSIEEELQEAVKLTEKDGKMESDKQALARALYLPGEPSDLPQSLCVLVEKAKTDPQKKAVLQMSVSLQVYTFLMIRIFVETSAKLIKYNMVEQLPDKVEEICKKQLDSEALQDLFAEDEETAQKRKRIEEKMNVFQDIKAELKSLTVTVSPVQRQKHLEKAEADEEDEQEEYLGSGEERAQL